MNTKVLFSVLLAIGLIFTACDNEDDSVAKPVIEIHGLGMGDSHGDDRQAMIGSDIHIDIDVVAEGKIDKIQVIIHPEGDEHKSAGEHEEWEVDTTYTKFSGLKNTTFHEHIDVAETADTGHYHFDFIVTDMEGNQSSVEAELELIEQPSNIAVKNLSINGGEHDVSKATGNFNISFDASVDAGTLASYSIEAHNHPMSGKEEDEYKIIDSTFTDSFSGLTSASVNKTITIDTAAAPIGQYHVEIIITDSDENEKVVSGHIDLEK